MYKLRGYRVMPMKEVDIIKIAIRFSIVLSFNKKNVDNLAALFEQFSEYHIIIDPVADEEWQKLTHNLTLGHFDPSCRTIRIPERIYNGACSGNQDDLFVMFHELGHLFLGHRPVLHTAKDAVTYQEDAEWQADFFAKNLLRLMGYEMKSNYSEM